MSAAQTIEIDLGPRALASTPDQPFAMSPDEVRAISAYVAEVRVVWDAIPDFRVPDALKDMVAACSRWESETYVLIRDMADSIAEYGSRAAPRRYRELEELLPELTSDPDGGARAGFESILEELIETCRRHADGSLQVVKSVSGFSDSMSRAEEHIRAQLASRRGRPIESWEGLLWKAVEKSHGDPRAALAAAQKIWGVWQSLYTDLLNVRDTTARVLDSRLPFLFRVKINLAIKQWQDLGEGAWAFRTSIAL
jgi:hypothetical protein